MTNAVLEMKDIQKSIKKKRIIESFQLILGKGEILALVGGNGAGKSTLLRMIVGLTQPTEGEIMVCNERWKGNRHAFLTQIGYMPDDFNFGQSLTAKETLHFYAALKGVPRDQVEQYLLMVGLDQVKNQKVSTFSKGMKQRLLFAQAMLGNPKLLVLDEPTNGLDPYWMEQFVHLVSNLKQKGHSVIFSTHQLDIAEVVADRLILLQNGLVIREGTTKELLKMYGEKGLSGAFSELYLQGNAILSK